MNMKKFIAAMAATAVSVISMAAFSVSAATTEIPYTESAGTLATDNDGKSLRRNILNIWGNSVEDIAQATVVEDKVTVNFTVSGIGTNSSNTNEDGSKGDDYYAWIAGSIGSNPQVWTQDEAADSKIAITGDGDYSVTWDVAEDADSIQCLILQTNINFYNYGQSIEESGLNIEVTSITTGYEDAVTETPSEDESSETPSEDESSETPSEGESSETPSEESSDNTESGADTESSADTESGADTESSADSNADSSSTAGDNDSGSTPSEESTPTGVAGVGTLIAAVAFAGTAAYVSRKK